MGDVMFACGDMLLKRQDKEPCQQWAGTNTKCYWPAMNQSLSLRIHLEGCAFWSNIYQSAIMRIITRLMGGHKKGLLRSVKGQWWPHVWLFFFSHQPHFLHARVKAIILARKYVLLCIKHGTDHPSHGYRNVQFPTKGHWPFQFQHSHIIYKTSPANPFHSIHLILCVKYIPVLVLWVSEMEPLGWNRQEVFEY